MAANTGHFYLPLTGGKTKLDTASGCVYTVLCGWGRKGFDRKLEAEVAHRGCQVAS